MPCYLRGDVERVLVVSEWVAGLGTEWMLEYTSPQVDKKGIELAHWWWWSVSSEGSQPCRPAR